MILVLYSFNYAACKWSLTVLSFASWDSPQGDRNVSPKLFFSLAFFLWALHWKNCLRRAILSVQPTRHLAWLSPRLIWSFLHRDVCDIVSQIGKSTVSGQRCLYRRRRDMFSVPLPLPGRLSREMASPCSSVVVFRARSSPGLSAPAATCQSDVTEALAAQAGLPD